MIKFQTSTGTYGVSWEYKKEKFPAFEINKGDVTKQKKIPILDEEGNQVQVDKVVEAICILTIQDTEEEYLRAVEIINPDKNLCYDEVRIASLNTLLEGLNWSKEDRTILWDAYWSRIPQIDNLLITKEQLVNIIANGVLFFNAQDERFKLENGEELKHEDIVTFVTEHLQALSLMGV